jgi:hypothetical protein
MNSDHAISAVAEVIPPPIPEAAPVETSAKKLFTSKDSIEAAKSFGENLTLLRSIYSLHSPDEARKIVRSAYLKAYEETSDADVDNSNKLLGGNLFSEEFGLSSANVSKSRLSTSTNNSSASTVVIYVNGIFNDLDAPAQALIEFENILSERGLRGKVELYNFYNPSSAYTNNSLGKCLLRSMQTLSYNGWRRCEESIANIDLVQSSRQIAEIIGFTHPETEPESKTLAKIIKQERANGRKIILIGHSQGNLMIIQALEELREYDKCISIISLAGPSGKSSWAPWTEPNLDGFVVYGDKTRDIINILGSNDFPAIKTDISNSLDTEVAKYDNTAGMIGIHMQVSSNVKLHSLLGSYLAGDKSRELVGRILEDQYNMLEKRSDCTKPSGQRIYATSGESLTLGPSNLWIVPPYSYGVDTLVSRIEDRHGDALTLTDLAISPSGEVWGVSPDYLYKLSADSGVILGEEVSRFITVSPNAAAFSPTGDMYVAESIGGAVIGFNPYTLDVFWRGNLGRGLSSAGDLAFAPDGRLFAVVEDSVGKNYLATVDYLHDGKATLVSNEDLGEDKIYGLAFIGQNLFGLTIRPHDKGSLVSISTSTAKVTFVRKLSFNTFGAATDRSKK